MSHCAIVVFLLLWALWSVTQALLLTVNPFETGVYLTGGRRVLHGQFPYLQFFSIYGPGVYYLAAAGLSVFRDPRLAAWVVFGPCDLLACLLTYLLARRAAPGRIGPVLTALAAVTWCSATFRLVLLLAAALAILNALECRRPRWAVLSGMLTGANVLLQQDVFAYATASILMWIVLLALARLGSAKSRAPLLAVGGGFLLGIIISWLTVIAWLGSHGAIHAFVNSAFVVPMRRYDKFAFGRFVRPWRAPPLDQHVVSAWARFGIDAPVRWFTYTLPFYLVPATYVAALVVLWAQGWDEVRWSRRSSAVLLITLLGIFLYRPVWNTADITKLHVNSLPAALLIIAGLTSFAGLNNSPFRRALAITGMILFVLFCVYPTVQQLSKRKVGQNGAGEIRRAGGADLLVVENFLLNNPAGASVFCAPNCPLLYVTTDLNNPTQFDYLDPIIDPEVDNLAAAQLSQNLPRFCVIHHNFKFWDKWEFGVNFGLAVDRLISTHYHPVLKSGEYTVLERD